MISKEKRFFVLVFIFIIGFILGFLNFVNKKPKYKENINNNNSVFITKKSEMKAFDVRIPIFEFGKLSSEISAKKVIWSTDKPVVLYEPKILEYDFINKKITSKITGNKGYIEGNFKNKEIKNIIIKGNVKMLKFSRNNKGE